MAYGFGKLLRTRCQAQRSHVHEQGEPDNLVSLCAQVDIDKVICVLKGSSHPRHLQGQCLQRSSGLIAIINFSTSFFLDKALQQPLQQTRGEDISFQPVAIPQSHQVKGFLRGWQHLILDLSLAVGAIRNSTPVCLCRYGWLKDAINCRKNRTQFGLW